MAFLILKSHFSFEKWLFGFININNQPHVLDGYVVDKYFIDAKTEKIYPIADFSLINNVESFED